MVGTQSREKEDTKCLYEAAAAGDFLMVKERLEHSFADLWCRDEQGRSVLHHAVGSGNAETVQYLVERIGLNPMEGDCFGVTAWDLAKK